MTAFPSLFVSHGSPMIVLQHTPAHEFLASFGKELGTHARIALYQPDLPGEAPVAAELTLLLRD